MRRIFALAAMFALLLPALAAAQDHHDNKAPPPHPRPARPAAASGIQAAAAARPGRWRRIRSSSRSFRSTDRSGGANPQFKQVNPQHGPMGGPNPAFVHPGPGRPGAAFVHGPHAPPPGSSALHVPRP